MITDVKNTFAEEEESVGASAQVGDIIDLGAEYDAGVGNPVKAHVVVTTAVADGTSQDLQIRTCDTEGGTYTAIATTGAILTAALVKGLHKELALSGVKRYLQFYRVGVGTSTAGAFSAWVSGR